MNTDRQKGKYKSPEGSKAWEYLAIFTCSAMAASIGFVIGWNSPSIVLLMDENSPIPVTASAISTLVAMVAVGNMIGPPINVFLVDKLGRKNTILISAAPILISWGLITFSSSIWELFIARFLAGMGVGLFVCVCPIYVGEVSSPATRGIGGSLISIIYNVGIFLTFIAAPHFSLSLMAGIFLIVNTGLVISFWFMPKSPYFLVIRNRLDEAEEVLEKLRGKNDVSEELQTIVDSLSSNQKDSVKSGTLKDIFTSRANFRAFLCVTLFSVTHHFGGYFTVLTYGQLIFKGTSNVMSDYVVNILIGITQVISALLTTFIVDKLGRKPLILASGISATFCNLAIGLYFYAMEYAHVDVRPYSWALLISCTILIFTFNCGLVCLQIILMSEIFATEIKGIAMCLVGVISGLLNSLGSVLYIWVAINLNCGHSVPFLCYFVIVPILTLIIFCITPETKGKTLVEIQTKLNKPLLWLK